MSAHVVELPAVVRQVVVSSDEGVAVLNTIFEVWPTPESVVAAPAMFGHAGTSPVLSGHVEFGMDGMEPGQRLRVESPHILNLVADNTFNGLPGRFTVAVDIDVTHDPARAATWLLQRIGATERGKLVVGWVDALKVEVPTA